MFIWKRDNSSPLLLLGAALSLGVFAWLLSYHPSAGRAYAAYGGVYVACAVLWGWLVEEQPPDRWDIVGALVCLVGMALITFGPRGDTNGSSPIAPARADLGTDGPTPPK